MHFKLGAVMTVLLSIAVAACGSDAGQTPADAGERSDLVSQPPPSPMDAAWTLTDAGECISPVWPPVHLACTVDEHPCGGQSTCRSCNAGLGLWGVMPVWPCVCTDMTVYGSPGLYWQCPGGPACHPGPGTFVDSQCTKPSVIDAGIDQAGEDSGGA